MSASDSRFRLFKRVAAEFLVIFAGVTLGLLADDWRQEREERREAQAALALLHDDLVNDSAELANSIAVLERHSSAAVWVQRHWNLNEVNVDSAGMAFRSYLVLPQFTFPASGFESLRADNRLSLIQPDSLRAALIQYYDAQSYLERGFGDLVTEKERTVDALSPYFLRPPARDSTNAWPLVDGPAEMTVPWQTVRVDNAAYNQVSYSGAIASVWLRSVGVQQELNQRLLALIRGSQ